MPNLIDEMENRKDAVVNYIKKNDGCTQLEATNHLKGISSVVTTHKIIHQLVEDGTILLKHDKKNRQTHHLHINDKYASIDKEIDKIKQLMDLMDPFLNAYQRLRIEVKTLPSDVSLPKLEGDTDARRRIEDPNADKKFTNRDDIHHYLIYPYQEAVHMMLLILFRKIDQTIISEKDADKFRRRTVILLIRLAKQIFDISKEREYLDMAIEYLTSWRLPTTKQFAKREHLDIGVRKVIVERIQEFEENFLSK